MPPEFPSVSELTESYETADRFTREVAQFRSAVAVPANNELRYAGHHLLQALDGQKQISKPDELRKAKNHCERAMYDAAEAGILYAIDEIGRFQDDYNDVVVSRVVRDYPNIRALAIGAQATLAQGRGSRASVQQQTTEYMELFRQLRDAVRVLDGSRDDLNAMIDEDRAKEQSESRRFLLQFVVRVAGSLLAAMGLIWTIWYTLTSGDVAPGS
ncbi:MAG: hypothetical protein F4X11_19760 [Acidobacteria bacterium]|nr:hypothetical protein [Acidobacteriota bacterium]